MASTAADLNEDRSSGISGLMRKSFKEIMNSGSFQDLIKPVLAPTP